MIEFLGCKAKDRISGFSGTVTGICHYISGCNQALISPTIGEKGELREGHWFDVQRLEVDNSKPIVLDNSKSPGFGQVPARNY